MDPCNTQSVPVGAEWFARLCKEVAVHTKACTPRWKSLAVPENQWQLVNDSSLISGLFWDKAFNKGYRNFRKLPALTPILDISTLPRAHEENVCYMHSFLPQIFNGSEPLFQEMEIQKCTGQTRSWSPNQLISLTDSLGAEGLLSNLLFSFIQRLNHLYHGS